MPPIEMQPHPLRSIVLPRDVLLGHDALSHVVELTRPLNPGAGVLLVCDRVTREIAADTVAEAFKAKGMPCECVEIDEADEPQVQRVEQLLDLHQAGIAIGVGGGRPIDVAKLASFRKGTSFISVPTAASHDGVASQAASIRVDGVKVSITAHAPHGILVDTGIIAASPYRLLAAGCGDILSNYSAVRDWRLSQEDTGEHVSEYSFALSQTTANIIVQQAAAIPLASEDTASLIATALISSGVAMSIAGSSRPASGAEHLFSHALDRIAPDPALHGEQCAIGTLIALQLHDCDWHPVKQAMETIGIPSCAEAIGMDEGTILDAWELAATLRPDRYTILNKSAPTRTQYRDAAKACGVI